MGDAIDDVSLYNCTASLLMQLDSSVNAKFVWTLNRSQVVDLLEVALTQTDSSAQWTALRDFISECLLPAQRPYDLAWWQKLMWAVVFGAMLVVATGGNIIVMWIVLGKQIIYLSVIGNILCVLFKNSCKRFKTF